MTRKQIICKKKILKDTLTYNGEILLEYCIEYPEFYTTCYKTCLPTVNEFYRNRAFELRRYYETDLFDMAVEQYKDAIENGFPIRVFEAVSAFVTTCLCGCIISLYSDRYEYTGGAHGNTVRESQTWDLSRCGAIALSMLVRCQPDFKTYILMAVEAQIRESPDIYFENYPELIEQTFNENSFYATPKGIMFYYQQYDIAPYASGIPEFLLPYSDCVINPQTLCGQARSC